MSKPKRSSIPMPKGIAVGSRESKTSGRAGARARRASVFKPQSYLRHDRPRSRGVEHVSLGDLSQAEIVEHFNKMWPDVAPERPVDREVRRKAQPGPMADRWNVKVDPRKKLQELIAETLETAKRPRVRRWTEVRDGKLVARWSSYWYLHNKRTRPPFLDWLADTPQGSVEVSVNEPEPKSLEEFLQRFPSKAEAVARLLLKINPERKEA